MGGSMSEDTAPVDVELLFLGRPHPAPRADEYEYGEGCAFLSATLVMLGMAVLAVLVGVALGLVF